MMCSTIISVKHFCALWMLHSIGYQSKFLWTRDNIHHHLPVWANTPLHNPLCLLMFIFSSSTAADSFLILVHKHHLHNVTMCHNMTVLYTIIHFSQDYTSLQAVLSSGCSPCAHLCVPTVYTVWVFWNQFLMHFTRSCCSCVKSLMQPQ